MMFKIFKSICFFGVLITLLSNCNNKKEVQGDLLRPNIWIIAEDISQDLPCYGNELVSALDDLKNRNERYQNAISNVLACFPSSIPYLNKKSHFYLTILMEKHKVKLHTKNGRLKIILS